MSRFHLWSRPSLSFLALALYGLTSGDTLHAEQRLSLFDSKTTLSAERYEPQHCEAEVLGTASEASLVVRTEADEDYPGVTFTPESGYWDLSDLPVVELFMRSRCDQDTNVILSLENSNSNGRQGCSAAKINLPAGREGKLRLVLGMWHGQVSGTFDPSKVARAKVLIDRVLGSREFSIVEINASSPRDEISDVLQSEYFRGLQPFMAKGVNIGNTFEGPAEGVWAGPLKDEHLTQIREAGFDSIRLPVRWSAHAEKQPPYTIDSEFRERIQYVVDAALDRQLGVVLNIHHYQEIFEDPEANRERFLELWRQISKMFVGYSEKLAFEILNEPHGKLDAKLWNPLVIDTLKIIRGQHPNRWVVIGPPDWNSVKGLDQLDWPSDDDHLAMTFHYYSPMALTHQGASWTGNDADQWLGTRWTGSMVERTQMQSDFNRALRFGYEHKVPIYLGEFGAYEKAPMESRITWTRAVTEEARSRKMGYAYWEFYSGFGIFKPEKGDWLPPLRDAVLGVNNVAR